MNFRINLRTGLLLILVAAALLFMVRAASVPLLDPDESRFARTSVEMLRGGDPVVPRFEGRTRLSKPPLVHWIQSFLFGIFGSGEWVARLHAALATLGSMLLVGWVAARRFGDEAGLWAASILITMPLVFVPARLGTLDALLAVHVLAVIAMDLVPGRPGAVRSLVVGGLLGLAFLVKGPVGVLVPLLVILAGRTATGRPLLPSVTDIVRSLAAWCFVVLPWGLALLHRLGPGPLWTTLQGEALERFFAGTVHVEPFWYYGKVVAVGILPWLAPFCLALVRLIRMRREAAARTALYVVAGLTAGLVFFSISQGKLPTYILPLAPLAAVLVTWELGREIEEASRRVLGSTLLAATIGSLAVLLVLAGTMQLDGEPRTVALTGAAILAVGAVISGHGALGRRPRQAYAATAASTFCFLLVVAIRLLPAIGDEKSAAALIDAVPELRSERPYVTVELRVPSLTFYLDRAPEVIEMEQLGVRLSAQDTALFVLADVDLANVPAECRPRMREIGRHGKLRVFEGAPENSLTPR